MVYSHNGIPHSRDNEYSTTTFKHMNNFTNTNVRGMKLYNKSIFQYIPHGFILQNIKYVVRNQDSNYPWGR